jgi:hypothetical protein
MMINIWLVCFDLAGAIVLLTAELCGRAPQIEECD